MFMDPRCGTTEVAPFHKTIYETSCSHWPEYFFWAVYITCFKFHKGGSSRVNRTCFVVVLLLLSTIAAAQRRQPNKPSEPSVTPTPTGEAAEEKFPPEAGVVPPPKPAVPKSAFEGMKYRLVGPFRGGNVVAV